MDPIASDSKTEIATGSRAASGCSETAVGRLGRWFAANFDGDLVDLCSVKIQTTDNPGWLVEIDIGSTTAKNLSGKGKRGALTWEVEDGVLWGYDEETGDIDGLLTLMADLVESQNVGSERLP